MLATFSLEKNHFIKVNCTEKFNIIVNEEVFKSKNYT